MSDAARLSTTDSPTPATLAWLDSASIDDAVLSLRPDYRALLLVAEDLRPGQGDAHSEALLQHAETSARQRQADPHVEAWNDAYRAFGAKPQRTRPSVQALLRRVEDGLPRIDRLTDVYNAISVRHSVPIGGEDLDSYQGPLRLCRANGDERFETVAAGESIVEHPTAGEVVWRDDLGVTCRRWNWRQCVRTRLTAATKRAVFIIDALGPMDDAALTATGSALTAALIEAHPDVRLAARRLPNPT